MDRHLVHIWTSGWPINDFHVLALQENVEQSFILDQDEVDLEGRSCPG